MTSPPDVVLAESADSAELEALALGHRFSPWRAYHRYTGVDIGAAETARRLLVSLDAGSVIAVRLGGEIVAAVGLDESPWESRQLGVTVGRTGDPILRPGLPDPVGVADTLHRAVLTSWRDAGGDLVIGRIDVGDGQALVGAQDAGFRVLETRVTYICDHDAPPTHRQPLKGFRVERHHKADLVDIPADALATVRGWVEGTDRPGHFYSDPRIDPDGVDALYVSWLERTFGGLYGDVVYTAWHGDEIVGFLAWLVAEEVEAAHGLRTLVAGLGAAASPEGRGSLGDMDAAVCTDRPLDTRLVEHTSQAGNAAVHTVWARFDAMRPAFAQYVVHGWCSG